MLVSAALGFGIRSSDVTRMQDFAGAVRRWQTNPDFRQVQREYVTLGVVAMHARWWGVSGERVVMGFRSLPGLPLYLAASDSSAAHYRAFADGEVPAYLHLTSEQGVEDGLRMIEDLGGRERLDDADIVRFLDGFKLPIRVATDTGAVASVRRLLADTQQPPRAFVVRGGDVVNALRRHVGGDVRTMRQLDDEIRAADPELWRTKQVGDFLGGIWAQGYGQIYVTGIDWLMSIRNAARFVLLAAALLLAGLIVQWRLKPREAAAAS